MVQTLVVYRGTRTRAYSWTCAEIANRWQWLLLKHHSPLCSTAAVSEFPATEAATDEVLIDKWVMTRPCECELIRRIGALVNEHTEIVEQTFRLMRNILILFICRCNAYHSSEINWLLKSVMHLLSRQKREKFFLFRSYGDALCVWNSDRYTFQWRRESVKESHFSCVSSGKARVASLKIRTISASVSEKCQKPLWRRQSHVSGCVYLMESWHHTLLPGLSQVRSGM